MKLFKKRSASVPEPTPRICADCRYSYMGEYMSKITGNELKCLSCISPWGTIYSMDLVPGAICRPFVLCHLERSLSGGPCGREGKLWEAK